MHFKLLQAKSKPKKNPKNVKLGSNKGKNSEQH